MALCGIVSGPHTRLRLRAGSGGVQGRAPALTHHALPRAWPIDRHVFGRVSIRAATRTLAKPLLIAVSDIPPMPARRNVRGRGSRGPASALRVPLQSGSVSPAGTAGRAAAPD